MLPFLLTSLIIFPLMFVAARSIVNRHLDTRETALPLAIFRIVYSSILFCEVVQINYLRSYLTDPVPYLGTGEIGLGVLLKVWLVAIVCLGLGLFTRSAVIVNYVATLATVSQFHLFEYHVDYSLIPINFLLLFIPVSRCLSLDRLRYTLTHSTPNNDVIPSSEVASIHSKLIVLLGIGLIYFDSVFWKLESPLWTSGLGLWLPASLPQVTWIDGSFILDHRLLVVSVGYLTLAFEFLFLILMWSSKTWLRYLLVIIGASLHLGIVVFFPIPWFGLTGAAIYLLVLPPSFYQAIGRSLKVREPQLAFFYDEGCPFCNRSRIIIQFFDFRNRIAFKGLQTHASDVPSLTSKGMETLLQSIYSVDKNNEVYEGLATYQQIAKRVWIFRPVFWLTKLPGLRQVADWLYQYIASRRTRLYCRDAQCALGGSSQHTVTTDQPPSNRWLKPGLTVFLTTVLAAQTFVILRAPIATRTAKVLGWESLPEMASVSARFTGILKPFLATTSHGVFMDHHFTNYNHMATLVYVDDGGRETWLPLIRKNGLVHPLNSGRHWVFWTWRTMGPSVNHEQLTQGLQRVTAFWAHKNKVSLGDARFKIKLKAIEAPTEWSKGFLRKQMNRAWVDVGEIRWKDGHFSVQLDDIESIPTPTR